MSYDPELEKILRRKIEEMRRISQRSTAKPSEPVTLTDSSFDEFVSSNELVVVDFWAPWCGPCRFVSPIIEELARKYAGKISFGKINVDENPLTSAKYEVSSIPTIYVFKNGRPVDRIIGAVPKHIIESTVLSYLNT